MKLMDLSIGGMTPNEDFEIRRMHHGLNVVFDTNNTEFASVSNLMWYLLFGAADAPKRSRRWASGLEPNGYADVMSGPYRFRISRNAADSHALQVQGLDSASQVHAGDGIFGRIDRVAYEAFYDVDFDQVDRQLADSIRAFVSFAIPIDKSGRRWANDAAYHAWKIEADAQLARWQAVRNEIARLESEETLLSQKIEECITRNANRSGMGAKELSEIEARITFCAGEVNRSRRQLEQLDAQIRALHDIQDRTESVSLVSSPSPSWDAISAFYSELDWIDGQVARWEEIGRIVQQHRAIVHDETQALASMTIAQAAHPYHVAFEIMQRMNERLQHAQAQVNSFETKHVADQAADRGAIRKTGVEIQETVSALENDLQVLSSELAEKLLQLRQRPAAAELKRLRTYHNLINVNLGRLSELRDNTIRALMQLDSDGADAVSNADEEFKSWAAREGYLSARRKFVGALPKATRAQSQTFSTRTDGLHQREQLILARGDQLELVASREAELHEANTRRQTFQSRQENEFHTELTSLRESLARTQSQLDVCTCEAERLARVVNENNPQVASDARSILNEAGLLLSRLTDAKYIAIELTQPATRLFVKDSTGNAFAAEELGSSSRQAVLLSICLAMNTWFARRGITLPTLLREAISHTDLAQAQRTLDVLREFGLAGRQIVVFTNDSNVADMVSQRLITGTYAHYRTPRRSTLIGTLTPVTTNVLNHFAAQSPTQTKLQYVESTTPPATTILFPSTSAAADVASEQLGETSWRPAAPISPGSVPQSKPVVYSDKSDYRTFPIYRPPTQNSEDECDDGPAAATDSQMLIRLPNPPNRSADLLTEATSLRSVDLVDSTHLTNLMSAGINTIGDLLAINPEQLPAELSRAGFSGEQLDRWQAQAWLMLCVQSLTATDASVLVACGITEPEQLENSSAEQVLGRIQRYLNSPDGRRLLPGNDRYQLDQIQVWHRALNESRSRWRIGNGYSRRIRREAQTSERSSVNELDSSESGHFFEREWRGDYRVSKGYFASQTHDLRPPFFEPQPQFAYPFLEEERGSSTATENVPSTATIEKVRVQPPTARDPEPDNPAGKFFLSPNDPIEAAPSIGPRTAEKFLQIGINSIRDFLMTTAESMAEKIQFKRITAGVVRQWQQQSALVCRVPNLRGHDAQLLVACGVTEPENLSSMSAKQLFELVNAYSETKEGMKIIRAGKKPDLQAVTDWIAWAKNTRSLHAA